MGTSISDGPGCLMLRCPDPSCGAAVGEDMINKFSLAEDKEKYSRYLVRSYIEDNRKVCLETKMSIKCSFFNSLVFANRVALQRRNDGYMLPV